MSEEKTKSNLPKPLTPVEFVKDIQREIVVLSGELHAISHLPDELKKLVPNAAELLRDRIRALHQRECWLLARNISIQKSKSG